MEEEPGYDPLRGQQRVFKTQLLFCIWIGTLSFSLFCFLRYKWPHIYALRTLRKTTGIMKRLPRSFFGWIGVIYHITDEEVLSYSGLDAYAFLLFFRMGIKIFFQLSILAIVILSPFRFYYTGHYDKDNIPWFSTNIVVDDEGDLFNKYPGDQSLASPDLGDDFPNFLWVYPLFTYIFSFLVYKHTYSFTRLIIKTRQKYLASQDSITDRTIRIDGIPRQLLKQKNTDVLKDFIEDLGVGKVIDIKMIYDCKPLNLLISTRTKIITKLEQLMAQRYKLNVNIYDGEAPHVSPKWDSYKIENDDDERIQNSLDKLKQIDQDIKQIQDKYRNHFENNLILRNDPMFKQVSSAFVTMDSVASAQMAAQTVLDPRVYKIMVNLAPAPTDIKWENLKISYYHKLFKSYIITIIIVLSYIPILFLVSSLATLLDLKSISKFWPQLGEFIKKSNWLTTFVTGILPPLLYSLFNLVLPFFYRYLSKCQGYSSNSEIELSTLLKNFFFIFFNLFLVFIITGTIWDYLSFMRDTTKIAYQLASSLKKKSLFYVDLILLQGLGMFPIRLLQIGDVVLLNLLSKIFLVKDLLLKTPRDYRSYYYTPPVFDFGIQLPQHILIFIIILIYSVVSTKIVASGLAYFIMGYYVYKYQLIYNYVHPPHSTGKVWPMIFRRLMLGIILFQLFMCGTLALEGAILLAVLCLPLVIITLIIVYNYEKYYLPLNNFIALRAIQSPLEFDKEFEDDDDNDDNDDNAEIETILNNIEQSSTLGTDRDETSSLLVNGDYTIDYEQNIRSRRVSTLDEEREQFTDYTHPYLTYELDGPWLGFAGENVSMIRTNDSNRSVITKVLTVSEWE